MAITQNLIMEQGTDFTATVKLYADNTTVLDLTGYEASCQMRRSYDSTTATATLTASIPNPGNGEIVLTLGDTSTSAIKYGRYLYDVLINFTSTGVKTRAIEGIITVTPCVTR